MKSFKFQKINTANQAIPLLIAILFLATSFFENTSFELPLYLNAFLKIGAYVIIVFHFVQTLWYKYYVGYNTKYIIIRLNRNILQERTFQFKHISGVCLKNNEMFFKYRNKPEIIELKGFKKKDVNKLLELLTASKNVLH